jgi:uncharacterized protein (DUF2147 family)
MKFIKFNAMIMGFILSFSAWAQDPALGEWYTVDDETGEVKSLVTLSLAEDGTMTGVITKVLNKDAGSGLCEKCEGEMKNQPIEGMKFIWDVKNTGKGEWEEGQLLDPESGTVYNSNITIGDNTQELEVRGYVGISLFGRSQTWQRSIK